MFAVIKHKLYTEVILMEKSKKKSTKNKLPAGTPYSKVTDDKGKATRPTPYTPSEAEEDAGLGVRSTKDPAVPNRAHTEM